MSTERIDVCKELLDVCMYVRTYVCMYSSQGGELTIGLRSNKSFGTDPEALELIIAASTDRLADISHNLHPLTTTANVFVPLYFWDHCRSALILTYIMY